jgi:uncharacterized membrane protein YcgQ (UPF0703/DUF1980 family)
MNSLFNRWLPALTLALWGGAISVYSFDGRVKGVLADEFRIYAMIAAALLLLGALVFAFARIDASCCSNSACGHGLSRFKSGRLLTFGIILLPIALAPLGSKAALDQILAKNRVSTDNARNISGKLKDDYERRIASRTAAGGKLPGDVPVIPGRITAPPPLPLPAKEGGQPPDPAVGAQPAAAEKSPSDYLVRTPGGNIVTEVLDLLYAAQDNVLRQDFEGKGVELVGQFMPIPGNKAGGNRFKAVRMFMVCCAADSRPVATLVEVEEMPSFPEMTWVKIIGTATFPIEKGRRISILKAGKVEKTKPPAEAMIY